MTQWYGITICEWLAIVLFGVELVENYFTLMGDLNLWNFFHKMYIFAVAIHCAHSIFYEMAIWSNSNAQVNSINSDLTTPPHDTERALRPNLRGVLKILFKQLPLAALAILAVFHSVFGVYFFYQLTWFIRQNFIQDTGWWYISFVTQVDTVTVLTAFLWLRWAIVFYSHEANEFQNNERIWLKIFSNRWKDAAWCACGLSFFLAAIAFLKLVHGVPYIKPETVITNITSHIWLLQISIVTVITFLSCFPHGICQILAILLSFVGFAFISTGEKEIHGEVYGIMYFLVPAAIAIAAMVYHVCFSPGSTTKVLYTKILSEILGIVLVMVMLAVIIAERKAFVKYTAHADHQ